METGGWRLAGSRKRHYTFAAVAGGSRLRPARYGEILAAKH
jgi:hypothetical protein